MLLWILKWHIPAKNVETYVLVQFKLGGVKPLEMWKGGVRYPDSISLPRAIHRCPRGFISTRSIGETVCQPAIFEQN